MSLRELNEEHKWNKNRRLREIKREWHKEAKAIRDADPDKKMLLRESKRRALERFEEGAETEEDFRNVTARWDIGDIVEGWRVSKHEYNVLDDMTDIALPEKNRIVPVPFDHICWPQLQSGNFIDYMSDCIFTFHDMAGIAPIHDYLKSLKSQERRRIFYYKVIRQWSSPHIAHVFKYKGREMSDRNIRKVHDNMIKAVRRNLFKYLAGRYFRGIDMTRRQKEFCDEYLEQAGDDGFNKIMREIYCFKNRKGRKKAKRA